MLKKYLFVFCIITAVFLHSVNLNLNQAMADTDSPAPAPIVIWPHEKSDLTPDPSIEYGRLPSGFRYVLMENREPKNRVSLHLDVLCGSVNELDDEQGIAHFLEHMLFCGSTNFNTGELVAYFQNIGMHFGADANAHTGFDETAYDILLPSGDKKNIEKGLLVLSDFAEEALILESEVQREKKVVLAEKLSRDSASYRTFKSTLKFKLPDYIISRRFPIGSENVIRDADRRLLKNFYDVWYRPENMILVMVGDFKTDEAKKAILDKFSGLEARAKAQPIPEKGKIEHHGLKPFYHYEKEAGNTTVSLEVVRKVVHEPDSYDYQKTMLMKNMGDQIVQNRLDSLLRKPETPFTSAAIGSGVFFNEIEYAEISAECRPENWEKALAAIEQALRGAVKYVFTESDLERVKKDYLSDLENAVKSATTRKSQDLARKIMWHLNNDRVLQSPEEERRIFKPLIESITPKQAHDAFKKTWAPSFRLVLVTGNAKIEPEPEKQILAETEKSNMVAVLQPEASEAKQFPYLHQPEIKGEISNREEISNLGIIKINFKNGLQLNLKQTDFEADKISMSCVFKGGKKSEPESEPGLNFIAESVINESGTGFLKKDELEEAFAGKETYFNFIINEDYFIFSGHSVKNEVELLFQLLYAYLKDPGFREEAYHLSMERFKQKYNSIAHKVEGAMLLKGDRFLAGDDPRFGLPSLENFEKNTLKNAESWVRNSLTFDDFEISIVGDFDIETVIRLAAEYPAAIRPETTKRIMSTQTLPKFPESESLTIRVPTIIQKGMVFVVYPTEDFWNISRTRRLMILGEIFSDKLRIKIREKLGASYSPYAYNKSSRAYKDYGLFKAVVTVEPKDAEKVINVIKSIASETVKNGITEDELQRAKKPVLTSIKDMRRSNRYWLTNVLEGSKYHPQQIEWARNIIEDYESITKKEIEDLALKYLDNIKAATVIILPESRQN